MNQFTIILIVAIALSQLQNGECEDNSTISKGLMPQRYSRNSRMEIVRKRLTNMWNLVSKQFSKPNPDTFIGKKTKRFLALLLITKCCISSVTQCTANAITSALKFRNSLHFEPTYL